MTEFRKAASAEVPWYATKYDDCTLASTGKPYKHQKGSGRSEVLSMVKDGMKVGALTKSAAKKGFDPKFVVSSVLKHHDTKDGAYVLKAPDGKSLKDIKSQREPRKLSPEKQAEREAKAKAKEEEKAKKTAEKEAAKKAKEEEKAKKAAEKEAAKKAESDKAAGAGQPAAPKPAEKPKKGKGKGK